MKEIIEGFATRVKSPLFGYFILSLLVLNWKPLFYLMLSKAEWVKRIEYFDEHITLSTMFFYPLVFSIVGAVVYPWINYFFLRISKQPTMLRNNIQAESEHALLLKKTELENIRNSLLASKEQDLIERAKRDEKIQEIDDEQVKESLKSEISKLRKLSAKSFAKEYILTCFYYVLFLPEILY